MNLKSRIKTAAAATSRAILSGQFNALVESVEATTFKSGAFGFKLVYVITDKAHKGRKIYENLVMNKADGTAIPFADEKLVRRLYGLGLSEDALETFNLPETSDETGDLETLNGRKVIITLEQEIRKDNGEASQKVKKVEQPKTAAAA